LIAGSTAEDFSLTAKGLDITEKIAKTLGGEYINLQNKYAYVIHSCIVSPEYRRNSNDFNKKTGRPKKSELSNKVITEA
jgi:hypothetical protein